MTINAMDMGVVMILKIIILVKLIKDQPAFAILGFTFQTVLQMIPPHSMILLV
jgi:hypothetical protein